MDDGIKGGANVGVLRGAAADAHWALWGSGALGMAIFVGQWGR